MLLPSTTATSPTLNVFQMVATRLLSPGSRSYWAPRSVPALTLMSLPMRATSKPLVLKTALHRAMAISRARLARGDLVPVALAQVVSRRTARAATKSRGNDVPLHIDDLFESAKADGMSKSKSTQSQHRNNNAAHLYTQYPSHGAPIHIDPSTPAKKAANGNQQHPAVAAAIAYAGPNFHNSPSPASLPAPKFGNRLGKTSSELERGSMRPFIARSWQQRRDSGASDDEVELTRGVRSTTAPAESPPPLPKHPPFLQLALPPLSRLHPSRPCNLARPSRVFLLACSAVQDSDKVSSSKCTGVMIGEV